MLVPVKTEGKKPDVIRLKMPETGVHIEISPMVQFDVNKAFCY